MWRSQLTSRLIDLEENEAQKMTLTELLPAIRQLSAPDKLKLIRILAEELDTDEDISPLEPFKTYDLPTPYNTFGASEALIQAMKSADHGG